MKKFLSLLIILCLIFSICGALADANRYYEAQYAYRFSRQGIVVCTNITVRESPSTSAGKYGQLHNGDVVYIVGETDGWYAIDLETAGLKEVSYGIGYIKSSLVKSNPYWIVTTKYTPVYADPWGSGMSNGEMATGTPMLVVSENEYYLCVQTRHQSAGSSFIRRSDIGQYTPDCEPGYAVVVDGPADVRSYGDYSVIGKLDSFSIVQVVEWGEVGCHIYYQVSKDNYVDAWIDTLKIQPVIN